MKSSLVLVVCLGTCFLFIVTLGMSFAADIPDDKLWRFGAVIFMSMLFGLILGTFGSSRSTE